jgi:predicted membrane protein
MPNHSHILGAWVYSGLLSLPLWMYIVALVLKALGRVIDSSYAGFFVPFALVVLWNIFFSPMGYRGELVFIIAASMFINGYQRPRITPTRCAVVVKKCDNRKDAC